MRTALDFDIIDSSAVQQVQLMNMYIDMYVESASPEGPSIIDEAACTCCSLYSECQQQVIAELHHQTI